MYIDKNTLDNFHKKYGLVIIDGSRYYQADLTKHQMIFEYSTPLYFQIGSKRFDIKSWKTLVFDVVQYLDLKNPKPVEELLNCESPWSKQDIFSRNPKSNYEYFRDGIYLNCNNTSNHAVWLLQYFLEFYNIDLNQCELIIRRYQGTEREEIQKYYIEYNKKGLKALLERRGKSSQEIDMIINNIDGMSKHFLRERGSGWMNEYDLFLFDNYKLFKACKSRTMSYARSHYRNSPRKINIVISNLQYLDDFYRNERDTDESMKYIDFTD